MLETKLNTQEVNTTLKNWRELEKSALKLITNAGELRFDKGVELVLFRADIYDARPSEIINRLKSSRHYTDQELHVNHLLEISEILVAKNDIKPAKLDLGKLAIDFLMADYDSLEGFVDDALTNIYSNYNEDIVAKDVILYGFGRIGRLLTRRLITTTGRGDQLRLKAVVIRPKMKSVEEELRKRAHLLLKDSVHGDFKGTVDVDSENSALVINGNVVHFIFANAPADIDYTNYDIKDALLIDNTGVWRDDKGLEQHLRPGVDKVLLTAPGKGNVPNIVYGANQSQANGKILSAASCTTNAIVPLVKVIDEHFGIEKGHIETIHAYTNDQNLLDNFHKKPRRGKAAPLNMVLTETGAAKAVSKVLPHLKGILSGNAVRVPTPDVSLVIMNFILKKNTDLEQLNDTIIKESLQGQFVEQIQFSTDTEYVSSAAIGMTSTSVVDGPSNRVSADGKLATIYAWYDNEYGYCCQVLRLAKHIANVRRPRYY